MTSTSEQGCTQDRLDGLADRCQQAAAAALEAALAPGGASQLLEALAAVADCLVQAEAVVRSAGAGQAGRLRPALEQLSVQLARLNTLVGGALELASGLDRQEAYGSAARGGGGRALRVDETG